MFGAGDCGWGLARAMHRRQVCIGVPQADSGRACSRLMRPPSLLSAHTNSTTCAQVLAVLTCRSQSAETE